MRALSWSFSNLHTHFVRPLILLARAVANRQTFSMPSLYFVAHDIPFCIRFIPSDELHAKVQRLQAEDVSFQPGGAQISKARSSRLQGISLRNGASVHDHKQWKEKDHWWRAVLASETLRSECNEMKRMYGVQGVVSKLRIDRMPSQLKEKWEQLDCARLD